MIGGSSAGSNGNFSLHHCVQTGFETHPASYPVGTKGSFTGVKRPGREADHSPPYNVEVKNAWRYISSPSIRLHGVVLSKESILATTLNINEYVVTYLNRLQLSMYLLHSSFCCCVL
jgi:hypothetical protein